MTAAARSLRRAVFLDRDGVINHLVYRADTGNTELPANVSEFKILPKVTKAIRELNQLGLLVFVVSNQPGVAKGLLSKRELGAMDKKLNAVLTRAGAWIDTVYHCVHHPQANVLSLRKQCTCRKPGIGSLKAAAKRFDVSLSDSYMVGDSIVDLATGRKAGCTTVFVGRWKCELCQLKPDCCHPPDLVANDLWGSVQIIKRHLSVVHQIRSCTKS